MNKQEILDIILKDKAFIAKDKGTAFAPANIALAKYWGKRNEEMILPNTSSLSVALKGYGTKTEVFMSNQDEIILNGKLIDNEDKFALRIIKFINLFRQQNMHFKIVTENNIPTGAGVASSASGGAALVLAFNNLFNWKLADKELSILARIVSGSACRSVYSEGFAIWNKGMQSDGMDSYAEKIESEFKGLSIGLLIFSAEEKKHLSRDAMKEATTSPHYSEWYNKVEHDIKTLKQAIADNDFEMLGSTAEDNALYMHKMMQSQSEPINYFTDDTIAAINKVKSYRENGLSVYFTIDAGPNLKLLYMRENEEELLKVFPDMVPINLF